jgi:hypothetical protein
LQLPAGVRCSQNEVPYKNEGIGAIDGRHQDDARHAIATRDAPRKYDGPAGNAVASSALFGCARLCAVLHRSESRLAGRTVDRPSLRREMVLVLWTFDQIDLMEVASK